MRFSVITACLAAVLGVAAPASADVLLNQQLISGGIVLIKGMITRETGFEFARALADLSPEKLRALTYVLDSPGGSPKEAFEIAKTIRDTSLVVVVPAASTCASARIWMLSAGPTKVMAPDAFIAVHSAQTVSRGEDWDALATTAGMGKTLAGFNIPAAIIGKLVSTPATEIARLSLAEMRSLPDAEVHAVRPFSFYANGAVVIDKYRAGMSAGMLIAVGHAWAGNRCDFATPQFQAGCLEGLRRVLSDRR